MSHCFLLGSEKFENQSHSLELLHYIEYLTYDLENRQVEVCADFVVKNISSHNTFLRGLHPGNVLFQNVSGEWLSDPKWTTVLLELASHDIGLFKNKHGEIFLRELGERSEQVNLLRGTLTHWGPDRPCNDEFVNFTTWESPAISQGQCCMLRIQGTIEGETYNNLMPAPDSNYPIKIMGGDLLLDAIRKNLTDDYRSHFDEFENNFLDTPNFYHVFFERTGKKSLNIIKSSTDLTKVFVNKPFGEGRFISWYWSDTDFNLYMQANGPVLKLIAS